VSGSEVTRLLEPIVEAVEGEDAAEKLREVRHRPSSEGRKGCNVLHKYLGIDTFTWTQIGLMMCVAFVALSYGLLKVIGLNQLQI